MSKDRLRRLRRRQRPLALRVANRIERATGLDPVADRVSAMVKPLLRSSKAKQVMYGNWLGHAAHPLFTDLPLGAWTSSTLLDLFGGKRSRGAAQGLLTFGLVTAVPTVVTGAAEWARTRGRGRRVGLVHAGMNTAATTMYAASLFARRRDHHRLATGLAVGGGTVAIAGGYLGGHLTLAEKVGTNRRIAGRSRGRLALGWDG